MNLSNLATLDVQEARIVCYQQVICDGYGRKLSFDYSSYDHDPRPSVLVLGYWKHPNTGNVLLGGINLNYLDEQQLLRLRHALPTLLQTRGLKSRYRMGRRILPDIFKSFYRTYSRNYVSEVTPSTLKFWNPEADRKRQEREQRKQDLLAKAAELKKQREQLAAKQEPLQDQGEIEADELKRAAQEKQRETEYDAKVKQLERAAGKAKQTSAKRQELATAKPNPASEPADDQADLLSDPLPDDEDKRDLPESSDCFYSPRLGFVWASPAAYVKWHQPDKFKLIEHRLPRLPKLAVYDLDSNRFLLDRVTHHARILDAAGLSYAGTVRLERYGDTITAAGNLPPPILEAIRRRASGLI